MSKAYLEFSAESKLALARQLHFAVLSRFIKQNLFLLGIPFGGREFY